ncbi:MAG: hypothetical protein CMQ34_05835 [Gammaproteobacteria bacterium]|nr:hypothetical protein [Gammaproteobacteria bacterium]
MPCLHLGQTRHKKTIPAVDMLDIVCVIQVVSDGRADALDTPVANQYLLVPGHRVGLDVNYVDGVQKQGVGSKQKHYSVAHLAIN